LASSTTYYYRVRATNVAGDSDYSNTASATTPQPPGGPTGPAPPTSLTATPASSSQITLNWTDNADDETGFKIERSPDGNAATFTQIATVGANVATYSDTGLLGGMTYHYRVRSTGTGGDSSYSNIARATTPFVVGVQAPAAPTNLRAAAVSMKIIGLLWTDNSTNETAFIIERSQNGVNFVQIAIVGANMRIYVDTGLKNKTKYYYRVRAINRAGGSAFSNVANATTLRGNGNNAGLWLPPAFAVAAGQPAHTDALASACTARAELPQPCGGMPRESSSLELYDRRAGARL
jgi:titin